MTSFERAVRSGGGFYAHSPLVVSGVVPSAGPVRGGSMVRISAQGGGDGRSRVWCRFEGASSSVLGRSVGSDQMECASPASSGAVARRLEVSLNGQQYSSSGVAFAYVPASHAESPGEPTGQ